MSFQPKDVLQQFLKENEAEGKEVDGELFALFEEFIVSANPKSLEESQLRVEEFLKFVEFRENSSL